MIFQVIFGPTIAGGLTPAKSGETKSAERAPFEAGPDSSRLLLGEYNITFRVSEKYNYAARHNITAAPAAI